MMDAMRINRKDVRSLGRREKDETLGKKANRGRRKKKTRTGMTFEQQEKALNSQR